MKKISLPKVGARPVIDGRRMGIRESLEEQTMNMAKATAALITEKRPHACGAQIECVIADSGIAGMVESAACEEKFSRQNVGLTISITPCWCSLAAHNPKGIPAFSIDGQNVQDAGDTSIPGDVDEKLLRFAKAGLAGTRHGYRKPGLSRLPELWAAV